MRWEDERYVRLYTRDTVGWSMLPWQARALFPLLMRKVDRAGLLELDDHGADGLAHLLNMPADVVAVGLTALIKSKSVTLRDTVLLIPNFLDAQEAQASDAQRKRDQRERARAKSKLDEFVTHRDDQSHTVTFGHAKSRAVTGGHSEPSLAKPSLADTEPPYPPAGGVGLELDFEFLAALYPKPNGKSAGKRWLSRHVTTQDAYDALKCALERFAEKCAAEGCDTKYLPSFDRWLPDWQEHAKTGSSNGSSNGTTAAAHKKNHREPMKHQEQTVDETKLL